MDSNGGGAINSNHGHRAKHESVSSIAVPLEVNRRVYHQAQFDEQFGLLPSRTFHNRAKDYAAKKCSSCSGSNVLKACLGCLPITQWLPKYDWRHSLGGDAIAGFTVAIMHIPQGMAYASLASVPPIYGLYTSFFSTLIYMLFGTSRHVSMGGFAVVSLMVGEIRLSHIPDDLLSINNQSISNQSISTIDLDPSVTPIELVNTLTLAVGFFLMLMGLFRFGFIAAYLSDQVVGGFTTGAACHVFTSQIGKAFGLNLPRHGGIGALIYIYRDFILSLSSTNLVTLLISSITVVSLVVGKDYINPPFKRRFKIPIPWELLVVVLGTGASYYLQFETEYAVSIVGPIPTGLPMPQVPNLSLISVIISDAVTLSFVVFVVSISMAKLFAKKHRYCIDATQESYAYGCVNIVVALFTGHVACASLTRSQVMSETNGKTQMSGVFIIGLLFVVLMWLAPLFEQLPAAVLASIILVAVKGLFRQMNDLKTLWPVWKTDALVWIVSFISTVILNVREGLAVSIAFALFTSIVRSQWPPAALLVRFPDTDLYYNSGRYTKTEEEPGVCVFRFDSPLMFTNCELFVSTLYKKCAIDVKLAREMLQAQKRDLEVSTDKDDLLSAKDLFLESAKEHKSLARCQAPSGLGLPDLVILDCSGFNYIDHMGMQALKEIFDELSDIGVVMLYAHLKGPVRELLGASNFYEHVPKSRFFPTIHDAVTYGLFHRIPASALATPNGTSANLINQNRQRLQSTRSERDGVKDRVLSLGEVDEKMDEEELSSGVGLENIDNEEEVFLPAATIELN